MSLRTRLRMPLGTLSLALGALLAASPALAGEVVRHSGPIVTGNAKQDTITIAEMGPWHGPNTRPVQRQFHLSPGTKVEVAAREDEPGAFKGEFVERSVKVTDLRPGDYATVSVKREGGHVVAARIEVVRPGARAGTSMQAPTESHL